MRTPSRVLEPPGSRRSGAGIQYDAAARARGVHVATVETVPGFVRQDGKEKVTGTGRYTADLTFTGMAHAKFRYADHSHARILRIDTSKAEALPGVVAVITQADLPDVRFGSFVQDRTLFA